jgi:hypothetical protein
MSSTNSQNPNEPSLTLMKSLHGISEKAGELLGNISATIITHSTNIASKSVEIAKQTCESAAPLIQQSKDTILTKANEVLPAKYTKYFKPP